MTQVLVSNVIFNIQRLTGVSVCQSFNILYIMYIKGHQTKCCTMMLFFRGPPQHQDSTEFFFLIVSGPFWFGMLWDLGQQLWLNAFPARHLNIPSWDQCLIKAGVQVFLISHCPELTWTDGQVTFLWHFCPLHLSQ